jgi:hypothetical protein
MNAKEVVHYYHIKVIDKNRDPVETLSWKGLRFELRCKYDWYFKYRAALLQVKYPRLEVQVWWGHEPATGKTLEQILRDKLRAKKAKITEYKNKIQKARENWNSIFPIEEDVFYQKALGKISKHEFELRNIEAEIEKLTNKN